MRQCARLPPPRPGPGGGTDGDWSDDANWATTAPTSDPTTALVFDTNGNGFDPTNGVAGFTLNSITLNDGFDQTITGESLFVTGSDPSITMRSSSDITIENDITFLDTGSGYQGLFVTGPSTGTLTLSGNLSQPIPGEGNFRVQGGATVVLSGTNTYAGQTDVQANSTLIAASDFAFGTVGGNTFAIGGTLGLMGNINLQEESIRLRGAGAGGNGALRNLSGNNTVLGAITLELLAGRIQSDADTLTLSGGIGGNFNLTFGGAGNIIVDSDIATGTGSVTVDGSGTKTFSGVNTYSGGTFLNSGVLSVSADNNLGDASGGLSFNGGTLQNTAAFISARGVTLNAGGGTFQTQADLTLSGLIEGTGALTKIGSETLTLTGANTYSGGTFLNSGVLSVSADNNLGDGSGALTFDGGTLQNTAAFTSARAVTLDPGGGTFQTDADLTLSGMIDGTGALTKTGGDTLTLTGANTYSGGTFLDDGVLSVSADNNLGDASGALTFDGGTLLNTAAFTSARHVTLNAGGGTFQTDAELALSGVIDGTGALTKTGSETLFLTGTNTYTGLTTISDGTLQLGDGGTSGSIAGDVLNNSILAFNRSDTLVLPGAMSGSGAVEQNGTGTTVLTGNNSYTGGTTISDGTLQLGNGGTTGSITGDVQNDGALAFNRSDTLTFDGIISGAGSVNQIGSGMTVLTGDSSGFGGTTSVEAGTLAVNGSLCGEVNVQAGGRLQGTGTVCDTTGFAGGIVAPGNSIGTITVNGAFTLNAGAIYEVELNGAGQTDLVVVNGTVNLTGATLRVLAENGNYNPTTDYLIIDNDDADPVTGEFAQVTTNFAFLTPVVLYDAGDGNDVVLTLLRTQDPDGGGKYLSFCSVATTTNQCNTAKALDRFPDNNPLLFAILGQTAEGARQAYDALSGEIHATVAGVLADDNRYVREAVLGRLMQASHSGEALSAGGPQVASLDSQAMALGYGSKSLGEGMPAYEPAPLAFWTRAYGAWGDFNGDGNAATADRDLGGFVSGMDANIGGSWRAGLATGASFSNVSVDERYSSADVESYTLGGYLGGMAGAFAVRGGGMWAWNDIDTSRAVIFPGFFERQTASYDADTGQLFGEVAYPTQMGGMAIEPFAGLALVSIDGDSFRERGGALASLRGSGTDQDVGYSTLGLRAATTMQFGGMQLVPHLSAAWQHAFDDVTPGAALAFASTGIGFGVTGVPLAEDSALIDAGLDFALGANTTAGVSYTGQFGDGVTDNGVKGRFTWLF